MRRVRRLWGLVRHIDLTGECREVAAVLDARHADVEQLGERLREVERRNHFSPMVAAAIARAPREA